ncbi:sugar O-acetyltransferase [Pilimelia terevasa]|uniref:sugar O-acetyltransferase n=1 Tax=Pilimelia terevasa TaxID=53372 RepID=UPI0027E50B42|nr:sugar O-acetyltransferase [Pilimelia terevasa]
MPQSMRARMLAGLPYRADDPALVAESRRARALTHRLNAADPADEAGRRDLLVALLGGFGADSQIRSPLHCDYGYQTFVGDRVFVNVGLVCLDVARVTIGDDAQLGPYVQLLTATHPLEPAERRAKWESAAPVTVGANAWLGGGVTVCPGVTIGPDTVVGAGAVVTRDLPAGVLAVGNPARVVRRLAP